MRVFVIAWLYAICARVAEWSKAPGSGPGPTGVRGFKFRNVFVACG